MLLPVRCFTCNKLMVTADVGKLSRMCCKRMALSHEPVNASVICTRARDGREEREERRERGERQERKERKEERSESSERKAALRP